MGEVYRATDTNLKRQVALKVLPEILATDPDRLARLQREAEVLASLNHSHIAQIYGVEKAGGTLALVMELVEGPTLADRIAKGAIPLDDALPIATQIAQALEAAHERGIIHRDLKPANIKLRPDGTVKVLDFGLAKAMESDASHTSSAARANSPTITSPAVMTGVGMLLGTAAYMSPEQARGRVVDRRADIWAFGCVLYEMLSGHRAFGGETISDTLAAVLRADPDWQALPAATPPRLRSLLRRCLDKSPMERLQAIGEARIALSHLGEEDDRQPTSARGRARLWPWMAATAVLAAAVPFAWVLKPTPRDLPFTFEVAAPEGTTLAAQDYRFALSPDGQRAVFAYRSGAGEIRLALRTLVTGVVTTMAGTEGATRPFWSPDSRWLGFFAAGRLQKVSIDGGRPQALCDVIEGNGGTWNQDDVIVFSDPPKPLQRVSASGGTPKTFLPLDQSRHEILQTAPYFLPDGQHFLYDTRTTGEERGIVWASLDGAERRFLIQNRNSPGTYAANPSGGNGWIIYNAAARLLAQPFDPAKGHLSGDAMTVADDVLTGPLWSTSATGMISFPHVEQRRRQLTWVLRNGSRQGTIGDIRDIRSPGISPDQKSVIFEQWDTPTKSDVWMIDEVQHGSYKLSFNSGRAPIWTADGSAVIYLSPGDLRRRLVDHPMNGAAERTLKQFENADSRSPMAITRDGVWVSCIEGGGGDAHAIFVSRPEGNVVPFPEPRVNSVAISPDGRWVAYAMTANTRSEIFVQASPQAITGIELSLKRQISTTGGMSPKWRADGKELFYLTPEGKMMAVAIESAPGSLQPGAPRALFDIGDSAPAGINSFDVTADGQRFLLASAAGQRDTPITVILNWPQLLKK
jgi:Tol biopolymer transport system component